MLRPIPETFAYYSVMKFSLCFGIMFVPTLFFGMTLPTVSKIASTSIKHLARMIGNVYAVNTIGTLLGAVATGLVFIPVVGLAASLAFAFTMNLVIATVLVLRTPDDCGQVWRIGIPVTACVLVVFYGLFVPDWNNKSFALRVFRLRGAPPDSYSAFRNLPVHDYQLRFYTEDLSSNVAVMEHAIGDDEIMMSLSVNGKVDASSKGDVPTQLLLGQLPLMLKAETPDVLLVGLGSGMTAGTVLTHPVERLDCVEISTGVAEAGEWFAPFNHDVLNNPRFNLIVADAKTYINTTDRKYDVVINEPSNPWMAGIGSLFSLEFFQDTREILKPDGIAVQWFHRYETDDEVVGSGRRIEPSFPLMAERFMNSDVRQELASINIHDVPALLSLQMMSPEYIPRVSAEGFINSDYLPIIEYRARLAFYLGKTATAIASHDERFSSGARLWISEYVEDTPLTAEQYKGVFNLFDEGPTSHPALAYTILDRYVRMVPEDLPMRRAYARKKLDQKNHAAILEVYRPDSDETNLAALEAYVDYLYKSERPAFSFFNPIEHTEVRALLDRCLLLAVNKEEHRLKIAQIHMTAGRFRQALDQYLALIRAQEADLGNAEVSADRIMALVARSLFELNDFENAQVFVNRAFEMNPDNLLAAVYSVMIDQVALFQEIERTQAE